MPLTRSNPVDIDQYIALFPAHVQTILERIRETIRRAAPEAHETISYRIPAFTMNGVVVYFAAFKQHIGLYPPVKGDARLEKAAARYAGDKGNLKFPLDQPIPYDLIERIVKFKVKQNSTKTAATHKPDRTAKKASRPASTRGRDAATRK